MKQDYIDRELKRIRQKIRLLTSNPEFQEDVLNIRKEWNIPKDGIKTQKETQKWYDWISKSSDKYLDDNWPKARKEWLKLRKQKKFKEYEKKKKEFNSKIPRNAFHKQIAKLVRKYETSPKWFGGIKRYVLFNDPDNMNVPIGISVSTKEDKKTGLETVSIEIDAHTTKKDLEDAWEFISYFQSTLPYRKQDKFQPIPNFDKYKRAYELSEEDKPHKEIADILSEEFGGIYTYPDISKFIKRYKKHVDIN